MFKKGDKVRCVNDEGSDGFLVKGDLYSVLFANNETPQGNIDLVGIDNGGWGWMPGRFEPVIGRQDSDYPPFTVRASREQLEMMLRANSCLEAATCFCCVSRWKVVPGIVSNHPKLASYIDQFGYSPNDFIWKRSTK